MVFEGFADVWDQFCETERRVPVVGAKGKFIVIEQDDNLTGSIWDCGMVMATLLQTERPAPPASSSAAASAASSSSSSAAAASSSASTECAYFSAPSASFGPAYFKGKRVVELGCGTAVVGIAVAMAGAAQVVVTDIADQLENIQYNVDKNVELHPAALSGGRLGCRAYHWGESWEKRSKAAESKAAESKAAESKAAEATTTAAAAAAAAAEGAEGTSSPRFDCVVCSDVLYDHATDEASEVSAEQQDFANESNRHDLLRSLLMFAETGAEVLIGMEKRQRAAFVDRFFSRARAAGFAVDLIHREKRRPEQESCNYTEVFRLTLKTPKAAGEAVGGGSGARGEPLLSRFVGPEGAGRLVRYAVGALVAGVVLGAAVRWLRRE